MNIKEIRRKRLKDWFSDKVLPEKDRSYLSQLINGKASFGEKAAARIESDYNMPTGYLSRPYDEADTTITVVLDRQEESLLSLFRQLPESDKKHIFSIIEDKVSTNNRLFNELLKIKRTPRA